MILLAGLTGIGGFGASKWFATGDDTAAADFDALHEGLQISDYLRGEIEARGGTRIPVLVPFDMTSDAATAEAHGFRLKINRAGYTAILGDEALDYVINGTGGDGEDGDYMMPYEDFDDGRGGSLSFGFRGADYQVELYCLAENPDPEANCLEAGEVEGFVRSLMGQ